MFLVNKNAKNDYIFLHSNQLVKGQWIIPIGATSQNGTNGLNKYRIKCAPINQSAACTCDDKSIYSPQSLDEDHVRKLMQAYERLQHEDVEVIPGRQTDRSSGPVHKLRAITAH